MEETTGSFFEYRVRGGAYMLVGRLVAVGEGVLVVIAGGAEKRRTEIFSTLETFRIYQIYTLGLVLASPLTNTTLHQHTTHLACLSLFIVSHQSISLHSPSFPLFPLSRNILLSLYVSRIKADSERSKKRSQLFNSLSQTRLRLS